MSSTIRLHVPPAKRFRRRVVLVPGDTAHNNDRYVSVGGFVDIETLAKRYKLTKGDHARGTVVLPSLSAASVRTVLVANNSESQSMSSLPTSPYCSEDWSPHTFHTPRTLQTLHESTHFTQIRTKRTPPISRYNRYEHILNHLPNVVETEHILRETRSRIALSKPEFGPPVELPGSLLLPSQGFQQTDPPIVPARTPLQGRGHTAAAGSVPLKISPLPYLPLDILNMAKRSHQYSDSYSNPTYAQEPQCALPPRMSSLPPNVISPQHPPPPIPLSQMTMEELMQILPRLDAAVIAHDWVPCMQKRQQELKTWLQKSSRSPDSEILPGSLDKDFRKVINESKDVAKTYYKLFEVARGLQNRDLQTKAEELDEAQVQRSEAMVALARHVSMHNDKCDQYEWELEEIKVKAAQSIDILSQFIHRNLDEALQNAPQDQVEKVLHVLIEMKPDTNHSSAHVRSDLYQDLKHALAKSVEERDSLREVCSQQMKTIQDQSKNLDQHIARMANIISVVQDKEHQNRKLREELAEARQTNQSQEQAVQVQMQQQCQNEQEHSPVGGRENAALHRSLVNEVWKRDVEITNLRRKLEKAYTREMEYQTQIRNLQSSQSDQADRQPSRLKRLLIGQQKSSPGIPTLHSMQNLNHPAFTPLNKEKPNKPQPPSPAKSSRSSPSLGAFCEPVTNLDHLELPAAYRTHHLEGSSPKISARVREALRYPQDEIDSAVSSRFHQIPSNARSAASTPRPQTPKSSSTSSNDDLSDYHRGRPHFNADPDISEVSKISLRSDRFAEDRQPLMNHSRVLSGITEVTEDSGSFKRRGSSVDSTDKRMYLDNLHAARALGGLQIG